MSRTIDDLANALIGAPFGFLVEGFPISGEVLDTERVEESFLHEWLRQTMSRHTGAMTRVPSSRVQPVEATALEDLTSIQEDALDMDYEIPDSQTIKEAKRIVKAMSDYKRLDYEAFPMPNGRVGIGVNGGPGRSMMVVCEPKGLAFCIVTVDQVSRQAKYDESAFLIDDFVKEGLRDMRPTPLLGLFV